MKVGHSIQYFKDLNGSVSVCECVWMWMCMGWQGGGGCYKAGFKVNKAAVFTQMPSGVRASAGQGSQVGAGAGTTCGNKEALTP